jgi:hypothetical protein
MLMFDAEGGLFVRDEVRDLHGFRMHTFADERETASPASPMGAGGYEAPGGYGGEGGGSEMMGPGGSY